MNMQRLPNPLRPDLNSLALFRVISAFLFIGNFPSISTGAAQIFGPLAVSGTHGVWAALLLSSAFMVMAGYRTRFFCLLLWGGLSLPAWIDAQAMQPGFHWRILFFWSLFLPLSSRFSVDSALNLNPHKAAAEATAGTLGLGLHFLILLFCKPSPLLLLWLIAWIPEFLWPKIKKHLVRQHRIEVYFDADCGFCRRMTQILKTFLLLPEDSLRPAQEVPQIAEQMQRENSWVIRDAQGASHFRFDAFLIALDHLRPAYPIVAFLRLSPLQKLGTQIYLHVSSNRSAYSRITGWLSWRPLEAALTRQQNILAAAAVVLLIGLVLLPETAIIRLPAFLLGFVAGN